MTLSQPAPITFDDLLDAAKAVGEETRLRILALLAEGELTVSDLTDILRQSQPRVSRHLKLLAESGLVSRFREGSWAFFRLAETGAGAVVLRALLKRLDPHDAVLLRDRERLAEVRSRHADEAQRYFAEQAPNWDRIRALHVPEAAVEAAIRQALGEKPFRTLLDLGTGTGRMLEMFAPQLERGLGIDANLEMLALARANLEAAGLRHCIVRQGDLYDLAMPRDSFDVVLVHQVLHYLDDGARAIREAARVLRAGGRLLVVDFAPHAMEFLRTEHAHRRLGFSADSVRGWMEDAGLEFDLHHDLPPVQSGGLTVSLWLGHDPRPLLADLPSNVASA